MEKDAAYFTVGMFVGLSLLALVGFAIWLMGVHTTGNYHRYTIYFTDPVSGLVDEAVVKYKGVEVGKVLKMRIDEERSDLVKVDIEVDEKTPISAGTTATIALQGITGQSYVELKTASDEKNPPETRPGEEYPVIAGSGNDLAKFLEGLPAIEDKLQTVLTGIDELAREGTKTVDSVRSLANSIKEDPSKLIIPPSEKRVVSTFLASLAAIGDKLQSTLTGIDEFAREGTKTADSVRSLADSIKDDPSKLIIPSSGKGVEIPK